MEQSTFHLWAVTVGTGATALFTGILAWGTWKQQRERISLEWEEEFSSSSPSFRVIGTIRNQTSGTIKAWRVSVRGPVKDVRTGRDKHESWAAHECSIQCEVAPTSSAQFSFSVTPDWHALLLQTQCWHSRLRSVWAKLAWKLFSGSIRVHHGASLHFQIIIDSKSNKRFRKKITETIFINPAIIEKRATAINSQGENS
ncbi:hypothetical protein [Brucella oryzae]|uniref:hypothetical protein n=1 Tax=Brucella oryzae TaxID=335286 RepID=UPI0011B088EE|nr:hypothetical protein [Brucella oryzae]